MDKLDMQSTNIVDDNIRKIGSIFPNVIVESEKGKSIDFDLLKQELSNVVVEGNKERYQLTWPGKKEAILNANTPINKTLRPLKDKSVNFDTTQNIYIEGDNLEALKLLQESYLNKIKCIYIDPPYNTGNDFIYNDKFNKNSDEELLESGQTDESGSKLVTNNQSNGRFHSDWLSMMYSRLKLSRNLLSDDGVIFISIDERENSNLRKICDEIFGEPNFNSEIIWKNKFGSGALTSGFIGVHEYVLCYSKKQLVNITRKLTTEERNNYNKTRDSKFEVRGGYVTQPLAVTTFDDRPTLVYPIYYDNQEIWPEKQWVWSKERMMKAIENDEVVFNKQKDGSYKIRSKKYLIDENGIERRGKPTSFYSDVYTQNGTNDIRNLFQKIIFDYTKPVEMIKYFIGLEVNNINGKNDIILDFFSGSATTAQAVIELNAIDNGNRKFIMVQLPETCGEKSDAHKLGYNTICDIGEERIRKSAKKIKEETNANIDYGFRVYKIDSSNLKDVYYNPSNFEQSQLDLFESNIKEERTGEDLLTQVILDLGLTLDLKIEEKNINNNKVFFVEDTALVACFDDNIKIDIIDEICKNNPLKIVFKDSSFKTDNDKINISEKIKKLSPDTELSVL
jgi:adenine-specific DNA-methyltransferase